MEKETSRLNRQMITWAILGVAIVAAFGIGSFIQNDFSWGIVSVRPAPSITVSGYAEQNEANQIATFTAGVSATDPDKEVAVNQVNTGVSEIIQRLEEFGIAREDIQTQNMSIYQMERPPFEERSINIMQVEPTAPDDVMAMGETSPSPQAASSVDAVWQASNSLEITVRDIDRASELANLLASSNATNVYGPRFSLDEREQLETALLQSAIENARIKAEQIAAASGRRLGRIEHVIEGGSSGGVYPMYDRMESAVGMGGGTSTPLEPGTTQVSKSVSVTFTLQ